MAKIFLSVFFTYSVEAEDVGEEGPRGSLQGLRVRADLILLSLPGLKSQEGWGLAVLPTFGVSFSTQVLARETQYLLRESQN